MDERSIDALAQILWHYNQLNHKLELADCLLVLGSHDTRVATRGTELFQQGYAPLLVFSGGFGRLTASHWTKTEAEMFAEVALKMGVQRAQMLIENRSTNTAENMQFSMRLLCEREALINRVILVTKPYMERRAFATWQKLYPEIEAQMASPQLPSAQYLANGEVSKEEMINIMVGETQRVRIYPQKGYTIPQEMPDAVWEAYEELVHRGFNTQLLEETKPTTGGQNKLGTSGPC